MACFTPEERQSFSNFLTFGFCDTFREIYPGKIKYSFWDIRDKSRKENKGWRLDYALVSKAIVPLVKESETTKFHVHAVEIHEVISKF